MNRFNESHGEEAALEWLCDAGLRVAREPDIASDTPGTERHEFDDAVLMSRFRAALARVNTAVSVWMSQTMIGRCESGAPTTLALRLTSVELSINDTAGFTKQGVMHGAY